MKVVCGAVCFLWHFLFQHINYALDLPVRKYGALCCPDFPSLHINFMHKNDKTACIYFKNNENRPNDGNK